MILSAALALAMAQAAPAATAPVIPPGTIAIEIADRDLPPPAAAAFTEELREGLASRDFTPLNRPGVGRYAARLTITRTARGNVTTRAPAGGSALAMGGWGAGVAVALPSNKTQVRRLMMTEVELRIVRRADGVELWRGRALTAQADGTRDDTPQALARKLLPPLIARYPLPADEAVSIP